MIPKGQEWGLAAKVAGFVFLAWLLWLVGAVVFTASETEGRAGLLGDFFGGFSALFGSLGFVGVVFTLYRQHQDAEAAEERRREDKMEEEKRRAAELARHDESVEAQERIAIIHALGQQWESNEVERKKNEREIERILGLIGYLKTILNNGARNNFEFVGEVTNHFSDGRDFVMLVIQSGLNIDEGDKCLDVQVKIAEYAADRFPKLIDRLEVHSNISSLLMGELKAIADEAQARRRPLPN
jgi:hypothetical protein